ncbi:type I pullulanase [Metabacillus fastidiosus]|nr:type I pullulanase [Metabacillus fastidiosus]MED4453177.1 type I pullulanase [Metabacillus fastidiosus]
MIVIYVNREFEAYLDKLNEITILIPKEKHSDKKTFILKMNGMEEDLLVKECYEIEKHIKYVCQTKQELDFSLTNKIIDEKNNVTDLQIGAVVRTQEFDEKFYYDGKDLGVEYKLEETIWKVWAPTATDVKLRLYNDKQEIVNTLDMERLEKGVWSQKLVGDYEGYFYTYLVCVNLVWQEAVDPNVKLVSINGKYGYVADLNKTAVKKIPTMPLVNKTDAVIYETHIRDFSIHAESGIVNKGYYEGFTELGTVNSAGDSTGISYLKELGITHIELLPINDFEEVDEKNPFTHYNWGYNPLHFNAPDGSYSKDPYDPYKRVMEVKSLIQNVHQNGLKIILDVVYNHVYHKETSSFEKIVPGYFFRYDKYGQPSNGTGVGNDVASERLMVRKFIKESVEYWLEEYDVDGFRFDLMGILDVETMNEIEKIATSIKEDVILLGEGWDLQTPLAIEEKAIRPNARKMGGIAFFNDKFRDLVKGSTFNINDQGFVLGVNDKKYGLKRLVAGTIDEFFNYPHQSINYVESHDNHTMWDKFISMNQNENEERLRARHRLATSIVLLSQGLPFLHSGQEFFRTKKGIENSYNYPDKINWIDWSRRSEFKDNVNYVRGLISLRKQHGAFRFPNYDLIRKHLIFLDYYPNLFVYKLQDVSDYGPWKNILIIHNNNQHNENIQLPGTEEWSLICTPKEVSANNPFSSLTKHSSLIVNELGTYVLCQM